MICGDERPDRETVYEPASKPAAGDAPMYSESATLIADECDKLKALLLDKNRKYGDSALNPVRIFSRSPIDEQIKVRLDDKLSRLARSAPGANDDEDVIQDLIGYLIILRVQKRMSP